MDCIRENILDSTSRYLLIVTKCSVSQFLIKLILDDLDKKYDFYYGSNFEQDTLKDNYSAKILNKVQVTMSTDKVMIMKYLSKVFPSLYDLFNQSFRKIGESDYARIALGDSNTQNYFVNKYLRIILLLDKKEIDEQDPPLLNRFEKHVISFENLLNENQVKLAKQILDVLNKMLDKKNSKLKNDFLNCAQEEIEGMIYYFSRINKKKENIIVDEYYPEEKNQIKK